MSVLDLDVVDSPTFTIKTIDEHLAFISDLIRHGSDESREVCFIRADYWLDKRNELKAGINEA